MRRIKMKIKDWQTKEKYKIGVATDHGGWELKTKCIKWLEEKGAIVVDFGPFTYDAQDDYPDFANPCVSALSRGEVDCALLICRSGVGMGIAANRYPNVRAVVAYYPEVAIASRDHNCSNVLVLPADYADETQLKEIVNAWIKRPFSNDPRHERRLLKIENAATPLHGALLNIDPEISQLIESGEKYRNSVLDLVASENHASAAVKTVLGSYLNDKYAEGQVGARLYVDCKVADQIEQLAINRACKLFGAEAANVQPYSGSLANLAVYSALVHINDPIMALNPARGGHSTHFSVHHISGRVWNPIYYDLDPETERIDYDAMEKLALGCRPKMIVTGGSAYVRDIDYKRIRQIADKIDAIMMVDMAHFAGLIAAGVMENPVPYADVVTSTTHKTLRGPRGGLILCKKAYEESINAAVFPLLQGGPLMHVIAAKAVAFKEASTEAFINYQKTVIANAKKLAQCLENSGLKTATNGTDSHMILVDITPFNLTGGEALKVLEKCGINCNAVRMPSDDVKAKNVSGIRLGTAVISTLGFKEAQMEQIARWIIEICKHAKCEKTQQKIRAEISEYMKHTTPKLGV